MNSGFNVEKIGFAQRQRLTYIESVAYWEGRIDRPRVCGAFNVSENHVTKDFRLYKDAFPGNIRYDERERAYLALPRFKPRIGKGSPEEYLALLRSQAEFGDGTVLSPGASGILVDVVPALKSRLAPAILNAVTRAISARTGLTISYQSRNRSNPAQRCVWPHALAFSGTRWHARAWDDERQTFIDLVLQRILSAAPLRKPAPCGPESDAEWTNLVDLDVIPSKQLSPGQAAVVAQEFGMSPAGRGWVWKVRLRQCLAGYFIYLHRLDLEKDPQRLIELRDFALAARYIAPREKDATRSSTESG